MSGQAKVSTLDHLVLTVTDIAASARFYCDILGMSHEVFHPSDGSSRHALKFGGQKINLHPAAAPFAPHATQPTAGSADLCFLSDWPLRAWQAHLESHGVAVEQGAVARTGANGPILSLYFRDPDGNLIEVANRVG